MALAAFIRGVSIQRQLRSGSCLLSAPVEFLHCPQLGQSAKDNECLQTPIAVIHASRRNSALSPMRTSANSNARRCSDVHVTYDRVEDMRAFQNINC